MKKKVDKKALKFLHWIEILASVSVFDSSVRPPIPTRASRWSSHNQDGVEELWLWFWRTLTSQCERMWREADAVEFQFHYGLLKFLYRFPSHQYKSSKLCSCVNSQIGIERLERKRQNKFSDFSILGRSVWVWFKRGGARWPEYPGNWELSRFLIVLSGLVPVFCI